MKKQEEKKNEVREEKKTLVEAKASETKSQGEKKPETKSDNKADNKKVEETKVVEKKQEEKSENRKIENQKPEETKVKEKPETKVEPTEYEKSKTIIEKLVNKNKTLKIVASESKTGFSFFAGKKRLCKLLKTKRGVVLEINVTLPKEFQEMDGMQKISATMAYKKHLGTMKQLYRASDSKHISNVMKAAIDVFKAEIEAVKARENKDEKKAVNQ